ncbi:hypothetical protein BHE90_017159 [Fusarium euwallaceae]|uniref:Uncharacterized protein n=1 Tax=Fusarium euwallaceae TaxID=1147111 RepID=A0A430KYG6_9HYPO|nr:hypothetical protein BHE90_017159 [Fusarium euwallaceae]
MDGDRNHTARLENNGADKASAAITVLKNVHTGEEIDFFPATAGAAAQLAGSGVGRILAELGMSTRGTASQRKQRMPLAIGVITRSGFGPIQ